MMKEIEISGANRFDTFTKSRGGSRAVIIRDGLLGRRCGQKNRHRVFEPFVRSSLTLPLTELLH